jgi:hypothetical protein
MSGSMRKGEEAISNGGVGRVGDATSVQLDDCAEGRSGEAGFDEV